MQAGLLSQGNANQCLSVLLGANRSGAFLVPSLSNSHCMFGFRLVHSTIISFNIYAKRFLNDLESMDKYLSLLAFAKQFPDIFRELIDFLRGKDAAYAERLLRRFSLLQESCQGSSVSERIRAYDRSLMSVLPSSVLTFIQQMEIGYRGNYGSEWDSMADLYSKISGALKSGALITAASTLTANQASTPTKSGLVQNHSYEIIACHCRGGPRTTITGGQRKYFFVLRNPWRCYGRYYDEPTIPDPTRVEMPRSNNFEQRYSEVRNRYEIDYGPIFDSSMPLEQYSQLTEGGVFEIEIMDFVKRFANYSIYHPKPVDQYR